MKRGGSAVVKLLLMLLSTVAVQVCSIHTTATCFLFVTSATLAAILAAVLLCVADPSYRFNCNDYSSLKLLTITGNMFIQRVTVALVVSNTVLTSCYTTLNNACAHRCWQSVTRGYT
jgi:membrane protein YdbS with pleckstrin-like domain